MKKFKNVISLIMVFAFIMITVDFNYAVVKADDVDYGSEITEMQVKDKENKLYVYYPMPNASDKYPICWSGVAPIYLVFGDGAMSKKECIKYADESGLAAIVAKNGSSIIFVQPSGDAWSDEDAGVYKGAVGMVKESSFNTATHGIIDSSTIAGTQSRIYAYGIGTGADYIIKNCLESIEIKTGFGMQTCIMASATLEGVSTTADLKSNDIPMVSIGNSEEINAALKEANTNGLFLEKDTRDYQSEAKKISGCYFRQNGILVKVHDYAAEGIKQSIKSMTITADKNSLAKEGTKVKLGYALYYSKKLDLKSTENKYPLVLALHGGGDSALKEAMGTEWPTIAKENGFLLACLDKHSVASSSDVIRFIKLLQKKYPGIDKTRIYCTGFSQGSLKTYTLFEQYPEVFAGVAPMSGAAIPDPITNAKKNTIIPVFYVGGESSPLGEVPTAKVSYWKIKEALSIVFSANRITDKLSINPKLNKWWGIKPDLSYQVTDKEYFKDSVITVNLFKSKDNNYYTALANVSNMSHETRFSTSWAAWDFLSQFSRTSSGEIKISKVEYSHPSDDGAVSSNSYNKTGIFKAKH